MVEPSSASPINGTGSTPPLLAMRAIIKSFPGVQALREVDFDVRRSEVHALVAENGPASRP